MSRILGIDEVGRGPWAGPLTVGACVLHDEIEGLTDSKKLSAKRRVELNALILAGSSWGLGWVSAEELDEIGLAVALRKAAVEAVKKIDCSYGEIIIDGTVNLLAETGKGRYVTTLAKADLLIPAVSAASIIAKVARDRYMAEVAEKYPEYGFERHVGYGTKMHMHALCEHGICPEHRRSFRPIQKLTNAYASQKPVKKDTTKIGKKAEEKVAEYLEGLGHMIVVRNWMTRGCEIDIVSVCEGKIYFTEVRYRRSGERGTGLETVTVGKFRQMQFAAENFIKSNKVYKVGLEPLLAVASVGGADFEVTDWLVLG
jgi:ribonuclease HII